MTNVAPVSRPVTVTEALSELLEVTSQRVHDGVRSAATLEMQEAHRRYWESLLGPTTPLERVDELVLDNLANRPRPKCKHARTPAGPETLRKRFSTLKAAIDLQHRRRRLVRVPSFPRLFCPRPPRPQILISAQQARTLYESLPKHRAEWYWLALWTGQHASDVERMTWADVDLQDVTMLIRNTKNKLSEGLKVKIPKPLADVLREMFSRDRPLPGAHLVKPWPSRKTTLPRHCHKCGLPDLNATALRHTCLSWIVRKTGITPAACKFAGHSSPVMMARTYAHALPAQLEEVTDALDTMAANTNAGGDSQK